MTEVEWLKGTDPSEMLWSLQQKPSSRKQRLYAVGCCRLIGHLFTDETLWKLLELTERVADGLVSDEEWHTVAKPVFALGWDEDGMDVLDPIAAAAASAGWGYDADIPAALAVSATEDEELPVRQAIFLRHIIGNPFRPYPAPASWRDAVVHLAEAMYAGQDCHHFALHDALLEDGHEELALHFREAGHPKGCWALDVILGKS